MPFTISKDFTFEAAHVLPKHDGKCARLHGHSFKLTVIVESDRLEQSGPKTGMVIDYGDITSVVKPFVDNHLDHYFLNESTGLPNPTSEQLALWIFIKLKEHLPLLREVVVWETCTARASYKE